MSGVTRKIMGIGEVVIKTVKKSRETKNIKTETVVIETIAVLDLECGHFIPLSNFTSVPKYQTGCRICGGAKPEQVYSKKLLKAACSGVRITYIKETKNLEEGK